MKCGYLDAVPCNNRNLSSDIPLSFFRYNSICYYVSPEHGRVKFQ